MQSQIKKWGNSLGIRIPKVLAEKAGLVEGTPIELQVDGDAIIVRRKRYTLEKLMSQVTPENIHGEIETGYPVGREEW
ncbi:AbrB/MazE/SpoVT family DNA-binding domain-containing protein [Calderihabitans maritimus]|uniref:Transcriptional regulator/antitoxin MazE n=1 Tax=Calderihabitans maritimus TaxID=1246530 RepID=A0A1Z5HXK4_9FIRM|nr:AbrB/MazE/SpoVT family DNA-binding domain-containing protein [Calderihabitans maritimus]GAW94097.1 transcriptional regulator/antitoxin MazE [Calderihabitans maritimus]